MRTLFTDFYQRGRGFSTEDLIRVINGVGITVRYFPSDDSVFIDDAYLISCPFLRALQGSRDEDFATGVTVERVRVTHRRR
jgi:hypothetical protein